MKKALICVPLFILSIISITTIAGADSIVYCNHTYRIIYSPVTAKIYLACAGEASTLELITIDPITLTEEHNFTVGGLTDMVVPVDNGVNLLILLSELDGNLRTSDGVLRKVNAQTGALVPGYEIVFDESPLTMVVDSAQNFAYVSVGLNEYPATITKISLANFQTVPPEVSFGRVPDVMALSNDDMKLYVRDRDLFEIFNPNQQYYYQIGIINTVDMSENTPIQIMGLRPSHLVMGSDNRLFASHPIPIDEDNTDISLIVINTVTDEIEEELSFNEMGIWDIGIDPINQKLYGLTGQRDFYDPESDYYFHDTSPIIVQFDLTDPSYTPTYLTLGTEGLWNIALASMPGFSRIFAIAEESEVVYYMDL